MSKYAEPLKTGAAELKRLEELPSPSFESFHKATKDELLAHLIELRLWCGQVVMGLKDLQQKIDIVASWQMIHDASTDVVYAGDAEQAEYQRFQEEEGTE